jgi:outer membrane receptor protein involved in Fe transport
MRSVLLSFVCLPVAATLASAQTTTPAPANPGTTDDQPIVLQRFTVNTERDQGYVAADSLAGGRTNTPIRITPAAMSSITRTFIDDLQITNLQDALRWTVAAVPTNWRSGAVGGTGGDTFNYWSVNLRGEGGRPQGGNPPTRNYFPVYIVQDVYNVDRIEVDRGPNSILFGIGDLGGSIGTYTKTARFDRSFVNVAANYTSDGGYRITTDINEPLSRSFALRLNALYADERGWRDNDRNKKRAVDLAATYKFSDDTSVRIEVEGYRQEKNVFAQSLQDNTSLWDKTTNSPTWGAPVANAGQNPLTATGSPGVKTMGGWGDATHFYVWSPSVGLQNWAGGYRTMGTNDVMWGAYLRPTSYTFLPSGTVIQALPSKQFTVAPSDALLKPKYYSATAYFDQRIGEHVDLELSAYRYADDARARNFEGAGNGNTAAEPIDLNQQLPNGSANPHYGQRYSDFFLDEQQQFHTVNEYRGQVNYHFDTTVFGVPLKQLFSASGGYQRTEYDARQHQAVILEGYDPAHWQNNMVWGRVYWDDPHRRLSVPTSYNGQTISYVGLPFNWYDFDSHQTIKYLGLLSQTRLWNDRVNLTLGARHDGYENVKTGLRGTTNVPTVSSDSGNTYTAGVVVFLTKWLGVHGNYSENFAPAAGGLAPSLFGEVFGPSFGKGKSVGVRISTEDGKYYASFNYYKDKSTHQISNDSVDFQGLWNDYFLAGGTSTDIGPAGVVTGTPGSLHANMSYADTRDQDSHGYEFELTANPTRNLRIQAGYSVPRSTLENDLPNASRYLAQKLSVWQGVANGTDAASQKVASDIANIQSRLAALQVPVVTDHLIKSTLHAFATYTFTEGPVDGLSIGLGATRTGEQYGNPWDTVLGQRILSPGYTLWSGLIGYETAFNSWGRHVRAKFQVNVDNLFGNDALIFVSYASSSAGQVQPMDYNFIAPRRVTFSASFTF